MQTVIDNLRTDLDVTEAKRVAAVSQASSLEESNRQLEGLLNACAGEFSSGVADVYRQFGEIVGKVGGELNPLPSDASRIRSGAFFAWLKGELGDLPEVFENIGAFSAQAAAHAMLELLRKRGCKHYADLGRPSFADENFGNLDTSKPDETIRIVLKRFMLKYWRAHGVEASRQFAAKKLAEVKAGVSSEGAQSRKRGASSSGESPASKVARIAPPKSTDAARTSTEKTTSSVEGVAQAEAATAASTEKTMSSVKGVAQAEAATAASGKDGAASESARPAAEATEKAADASTARPTAENVDEV